MIGFLLAIGFYLGAGILVSILGRRGFLTSMAAWVGATGGVIFAAIEYRTDGVQVSGLAGWPLKGIEVQLDEPALLLATLILVLNLCTLLYVYTREETFFYAIYNYLLGTGLALGISHDLFSIYILMELLSLVSILMIGYSKKTYQIWAGVKYLLLSSLSMSIYLVGMAIIYHSGGSLSISVLQNLFHSSQSKPVLVGVSLMIVGLAVKSGIFLFSMWLPDAHAYSATVVSALLSGMAIKGGIIGILRVSSLADIDVVLLFLGSLTGVLGVLYAVLAKRPKKILAFHTMSQVGYILIGMGAGTALGLAGATLHLLFHGLFKGLLFLAVGSAGTGGRTVYELQDMKISIGTKVGLAVASLSIMAIPPFDGFYSKDLCLMAAPSPWIAGILILIGIGTVISFTKLSWFFLTANTGSLDHHSGAILTLSVLVLASGPVVVWSLSGVELMSLLKLSHVMESLIIFAVGIVGYVGLRHIIGKVTLPSFPFEVENATISIYLGFLVLTLLLTVL